MAETSPSPPPNATREEMQQFGLMEIIVLFLSVYVLGAMVIQMSTPLPPEVNAILNYIDFGICIVFLIDFCLRFRQAASKRIFMRWGWIDLISCVPQVDFLRWGRVARLIRIIRVLRAFGSTRRLVAFLYRRRHRAASLAGTAILFVMLLVIFACISILAFETEESSNIKTPFDAVWWAFSTITTVGYGDRFPVTPEGRVVAMILMIAGISLFGVLTGLFAKLFVEPELQREGIDIESLTREIRILREKIEALERSGSSGLTPPATAAAAITANTPEGIS